MNDDITLFVDGDLILYRAASAFQQDIEWEGAPDLVNRWIDLSPAVLYIRKILKRIIDNVEDTVGTVYFCLTVADPSNPNFRKGVDPDYKANRRGVGKPVGLRHLQCLAHDGDLFGDLPVTAMSSPCLEADDLMGMHGYHLNPEYAPTIIVSSDKDMKTVPGWHMDIPIDNNKDYPITHVTLEEANEFLLKQLLAGDDADGIKGCPKFGMTTAGRFVQNSEKDLMGIYRDIEEAYEKAGLTKEDTLRTLRLLYILRNPSEYNSETYKVNHITPETLFNI